MMIRRHSRSAIFMHWFNAVCWLFLLFSGFALLVGDMQPIGQWWRNLWVALFGERGLLVAHLLVGSVWVAVYAIYILTSCRREVLPFLREILHFKPASDLVWCFRKGLWLVLGPKVMLKMGVDPKLPPQGFYNAGQRMVAVLAVAASIGLAITGVAMGYFSGNVSWALGENALQWCIVVHFACAGVMAIFLPVHIYMAALAPGEGPALRSMFTGFVPQSHAQHHNPLWFASLKAAGALGGETQEQHSNVAQKG